MYKSKKIWVKNTMLIITLCLLILALIMYSKSIKESVFDSINICLSVVIPSLYGFLIVSLLIIKTNIYYYLSKPFTLFSKYVLKIPPKMFSIFLTSLIGGYPVGAKLIYELVDKEELSEAEANNLMCYCFGSGPAFIMGTIATTVYNNLKVGLIIFISAFVSNLLIAIFRGFFKKSKPCNEQTPSVKFNSVILTDSITSAGKSLFNICLMIVFFAILSSILVEIGLSNYLCTTIVKYFDADYDTIQSAFHSFLDISNISKFPKNNYLNLPLISGLISFGGICVLIQIFSISRGKLNSWKFIAWRLISSLLSGIVCKLLLSSIFSDIVLSASTPIPRISTSINILPSIFLLIMTMMLLLNSTRQRGQEMI